MRSLKSVTASFCVILTMFSFSSARPDRQKFDEYGDVNCEDEMARLDNFAISLQMMPDTRAYIIVYGGQRGRVGESRARAIRIKNYLVNKRGFEAKRIVTKLGGYREGLSVELWLLLCDERAPVATPTVSSKNVMFSKGKIKKYEYDCGGL